MDMIIDELEQGAAGPADLLQQDPHGEVVGFKPFVASPDEERLAADVSTIRLQTKRLLGTQQKKLIETRKMNEGTWTLKNLQERLLHLRRHGTRQWGHEKTPLWLKQPTFDKAATQKTQEHTTAYWVLQRSCCWHH
jgi:hypothetical protein